MIILGRLTQLDRDRKIARITPMEAGERMLFSFNEVLHEAKLLDAIIKNTLIHVEIVDGDLKQISTYEKQK